MIVPTWDLFIGLFFAIVLAYAFLLGKEKIQITLISSYIGLVLAETLGKVAEEFLMSNSLIAQIAQQANISVFIIKVVVFALTIVLLTLKSGLISKPSGRGLFSTFLTALYGFLNAGFILTSIVFFLNEDLRKILLHSSKSVIYLINYHTWWIVIPALVIILVSFFEPKEG